MISAYYKQSCNELPGLEGWLITIAAEIREKENKIKNLVTRLSELPPEVSAEPIYTQLKDLNARIAILKESNFNLRNEAHRMTAQKMDEQGLKDRIRAAINALEQAPVEKQRPIYTNVLKFAELYPTKIKLGIYAPLLARAGSTNVQLTATGGT